MREKRSTERIFRQRKNILAKMEDKEVIREFTFAQKREGNDRFPASAAVRQNERLCVAECGKNDDEPYLAKTRARDATAL